MAMAGDTDLGDTMTPAERAAIDAVPDRYRVNLDGLTVVIGKSDNTIRSDMKRWPDEYPVLYRGTNGRDYVFDARAVRDFYVAKAEEAEAERKAEAARLQSLNLELIGGETADMATVELSPKEKYDLYRAETAAGELMRQRGELVRAAEVRDGLRIWNARVRDEVMSAGGQIVDALALDRPAAVKVEAILKAALVTARKSAPGLLGDKVSDDVRELVA